MGYLIQVNWKQDWLRLRAGWDVPKDSHRGDLLLPLWKLRRVPRNLRSSKLESYFKKLIQNTTFIKWWDQSCGGYDNKFFTLNFPKNVWNIPWELLIERLLETGQHKTVSICRTSSGAIKPEAPSVFDEPMRSLILVGDDGASIGLRRLDLQAEVRQIILAWQELESGIRRCVIKPEVRDAKRVELQQLLREIKPHILWFSGHGLTKPEPRVLFVGGDKVSPNELADLIQKSGQIPLYAIFWACSTGGPDEHTTSTNATPILFEELSRVGILAVLAMQAAIRDVSARTMAANLFRFLASGISFERALMETRAQMIEDSPTQSHPMDWACPVIWSASSPVENLKWNSSQQSFAKFQLAGRWTLRLSLETPAALNDPPSNAEVIRARAWTSQRGIWIINSGDMENAEVKIAWLRTLQAIPAQTDLFVLPIFFDCSDAENALKRWALATHERLRPGNIPPEISEVIRYMCDLPFSGWKKLCAINRIYLGIVNAPPYDPGDEFWRPLLDPTGPYIAIVSNIDIPFDVNHNWSVDKIEVEMDTDKIKYAINQAPRLAKALAVLNMPINSSLIFLPSESGEVTKCLEDWSNRDDVLVQTSAGPVIRATAREYVLKNLSESEITLAHLDCIDWITRPEMRLTPKIRERLLIHRLSAKQTIEAIAEGMTLCAHYFASDHHFAISRVLEKLGVLRDKIPPRWRLIVAGSYLQLGMITRAKYWLDRSTPQSVLDSAWKHAMQAEIYKSAGTQQHKENALAEINEAIKLCQNAIQHPQEQSESLETIQSKLLVCRQDRARILQYLFTNREQETADEYIALIKAFSNYPKAELDLAAIKRNYSELLRKRSTSRTDIHYQKARELLDEAERLARPYPPVPILAEILYEKVKFAENESQHKTACLYLKKCIKAAKESHHYLVCAIAQSRHFWKCEQFALERWHEIESQLKIFRHGWALRTLIDGRIKIAKKFESTGDFTYSLTNLKANQTDLINNPSFDQGSDRLRILKTYAGLIALNDKLNQPDVFTVNFIKTYSWFQDLIKEKKMTDFKTVWKEGD